MGEEENPMKSYFTEDRAGVGFNHPIERVHWVDSIDGQQLGGVCGGSAVFNGHRETGTGTVGQLVFDTSANFRRRRTRRRTFS